MNTTVQNTNVSATALGEYDFILVLDASGSMGDAVSSTNRTSRWDHMQESVRSFANDLDKIDSDGLDVIVFSGHKIDEFHGITSDKVKGVFESRSPRSGTPLAEALQLALDIGKKSDKNKVIVIFTDGVPDNEQAVADLIIAQANSQERDEECTFLFIQVGDDSRATAYLEHLDDGLSTAKFDIVDAKTLKEAEQFATTTDLILNAIDD